MKVFLGFGEKKLSCRKTNLHPVDLGFWSYQNGQVRKAKSWYRPPAGVGAPR